MFIYLKFSSKFLNANYFDFLRHLLFWILLHIEGVMITLLWLIDHIIILFLLFSLSLIVFTNDNTISSFIMCLLIFRTRTLSDIININYQGFWSKWSADECEPSTTHNSNWSHKCIWHFLGNIFDIPVHEDLYLLWKCGGIGEHIIGVWIFVHCLGVNPVLEYAPWKQC